MTTVVTVTSGAIKPAPACFLFLLSGRIGKGGVELGRKRNVE